MCAVWKKKNERNEIVCFYCTQSDFLLCGIARFSWGNKSKLRTFHPQKWKKELRTASLKQNLLVPLKKRVYLINSSIYHGICFCQPSASFVSPRSLVPQPLRPTNFIITVLRNRPVWPGWSISQKCSYLQKHNIHFKQKNFLCIFCTMYISNLAIYLCLEDYHVTLLKSKIRTCLVHAQ